MEWKYKCSDCGCNIDPGEGSLCDDCREKSKFLERLHSISKVCDVRCVNADIINLEDKKAILSKILKDCYLISDEKINIVNDVISKKSYEFSKRAVIIDIYENVISYLLKGSEFSKVKIGGDIDGLCCFIQQI